MKIATYFVLLLCVALLPSSSAEDKPAPILQVVNVHSKGVVDVRLTNASRGSLRIWKSSNSWGASRWRVLLIRKGKLITLNQKPQSFTQNAPVYLEMASGASLMQTFDLNDDSWASSIDRPIRFVAEDNVIVVYDVPFEPENLSESVWYGVASALSVVR